MLSSTIITHAFQAMGSQIAFWLETNNKAVGTKLLLEGEIMFHRAEVVLSRFDEFSELSYLNSRPGQWTPVSPLLWDATREAIKLAYETNGLFDPTQLNAVEKAGYTRSFAELTEMHVITRPVESITAGYEGVRFDNGNRSIYLPAGTRIDLSGIGKGHTAQRVVDFFSRYGACLVDVGGDVTAGRAPTGMPGWPVGIAAPRNGQGVSDENLARLWLKESTLATSGTDHRRWQKDGREAHHIIDPRTGSSAESNFATVSVMAYPAGRAEAWATASLISGIVQDYNYHLSAAFIGHDQRLTLTPKLAPIVQLEGESSF